MICGTKNDRTVRYALGRSESPRVVSTYESLLAAEQRALPAVDELTAFEQITPQRGELRPEELPVFVVSTFDSDLLLLRADSLPQSLEALRTEGYVINI